MTRPHLPGPQLTIVTACCLLLSFTAPAEVFHCACTSDTYLQLAEGTPWTAEQVGRACGGLYP
ncbi:MAG: hypothetical protein O3A51_14540, partial [Verrucomicrobia bacterium]|nr:hypothetical protein [Verrucomicrobiota bacterium]